MASKNTDAAPVDAAQEISTPDVVTKYTTGANIVSQALKKVVEGCVNGANIMELCVLGDKSIEEGLKSVYAKSKNLLKSVAFPTSISVNNCVCHFSPLPEEPESAQTLKDGDVAKIELGAQIDGFPVIVGHTLVVGASKDKPVTGRKADVLQAAHVASEACLRLFKPGKKNIEVTDTVQKIAESFECKPVEGMLSYQMSKNNMDGPKQVILNPSEEQRKGTTSEEFKEGEVYAVNVIVSTGDGKCKQGETRTTIYKKNDTQYSLKLKASRALFSDVKDRFGNFAFHLRSFEDLRKARMGLIECQNHQLIQPYDVLYEKEGEIVAQFIFTVLLMPTGPLKVSGLEWDEELVKSDKEVTDEEIKNLLNEQVRKKKNKKKK
ncbi:proliferation-associated protein 2G4 [Paraphysoderma sedebokerense]|nr:proliferation-associated protein 2G4 [Paraphysoderma sedebokerense]